jgi:hypothetical protein
MKELELHKPMGAEAYKRFVLKLLWMEARIESEEDKAFEKEYRMAVKGEFLKAFLIFFLFFLERNASGLGLEKSS